MSAVGFWKLRGSVCSIVMQELLSSAIVIWSCGKPSSTRTYRAHKISEVTSLTPTISASVDERTTQADKGVSYSEKEIVVASPFRRDVLYDAST